MDQYSPFGEGDEMTAFRASLATFFRSKREQLLAAARQADTPHTGLLGGFRERLIETFLIPLLPRRFSTGRGVIYGMAHVSRECDVVIWDSENYFSIPLLSYGHFFAESVRLVLESKTTYSKREMDDVREKTKTVRDIVPNVNMNLADEIAMLRWEVHAMRHGLENQGMLLSKPHIAMAAFFFFGGQSVTLGDLVDGLTESLDDTWPDVLLFLEAGKLILKRYSDDGRSGFLQMFEAGDDVLMLFAASILRYVNGRSVQVENPDFLMMHVDMYRLYKSTIVHEFPLRRPPSSRTPL